MCVRSQIKAVKAALAWLLDSSVWSPVNKLRVSQVSNFHGLGVLGQASRL